MPRLQATRTLLTMPTTTLHTVAVFSAMRGSGWQGEVPLGGHPDSLDALFRYFNRVDQVDVDRLEAIEYRLPSLTAGDLLGLVDKHVGTVFWYLCCSSGWQQIPYAQAQAYMTLAQDVLADQRPPMFTKMDGDNLLTMMEDGWVQVSRHGYVKTLGWEVA